MQLTNKFNLPEAIVNAIRNDPYNPGPCDMSVTTLISPPRLVELKRQNYKEITEDVSDRIWSLFGQGIHSVLERAEIHAETETRLSINRQNWEISGQFDRYDPITKTLSDYKVTSVYAVKNGARFEWIAQLNILATILREHGYAIKELQSIVILRDWSKSKAERSKDYPVAPVVTIDIPIWTEERCEEFIDERIRIHQAAKSNLPLCSPEEKWQTPDVFALRKEGRKTAVKLYATEEAANVALVAAGDKHYIEHRPGRSVRCEGYCPVSEFCDQWLNAKDA